MTDNADINKLKKLDVNDIKLEVKKTTHPSGDTLYWVIATKEHDSEKVWFEPSLLYQLSGHLLGKSIDDQLKDATESVIEKLDYKINRVKIEEALNKSLTEKAYKFVKEIK